MRIPKFRVWDNVDYMSKPFTLSELQAGLIQFDCACPIMQFTGFQDKNGSEIYEGDIVNIRNDGYADVIANVIFDIAAFWLYSEDIFLAYDDEADNMVRLSSIYMDTGEDGYLARLEIIGNIHQNPELLEGDK